ncbi:hypothetical protein Vadar_003935 [Vaccinium darrowii]|uniref:Uncharacterized protein n=1 Tax=Vaccinium darrowii TaxID=229202 RepID=A0ACB7YBK4_9ERIC|nr:hypothetical protein Vadar_003935 [Vaccinium darrowii]
MEAALGKSGEVVKEEKTQKRVEPSRDEQGHKEGNFLYKDTEFESAKAEMGEVREENHKLRMRLDQILGDYQTLQMQFDNIVKQETKEPTNIAHTQEAIDESELICLSLGRRTSSEQRKDQNPKKLKEDQGEHDEGLALRLDSSAFECNAGPRTENSLKPISPENNLEVNNEAGESWPSHRVLKTMRKEDDEVSEQSPVKKARVSVRVRCDTPTMNDGCQWRKYGQKIAKGNPCPRAYYRCTVAPNCPVRKQVQRCAEDMAILITTYEGTHNHQLPISATAMASTTSAAASMLLSGSSTSRIASTSLAGTTTSSTTFRGLNFYLSDNMNSKQYYLPNSSMLSAPSHPTITLDLTSTSSSSSSSHFNNFFSNSPLAPRYSSTNLNFSSLESNPLPISWSSSGVLNYGTQVPYNKNQVGNSLNFGSKPNQENMIRSFMQNPILSSSPPQQNLPTDTIAAATKAITSDPSFQSALATALTSIIGSSGSGTVGRNPGFQIGGKNFGKSLNFGETFPIISSFPLTTTNGNKCSPSYLNMSPPSASNSMSTTFLQPLPPHSADKVST